MKGNSQHLVACRVLCAKESSFMKSLETALRFGAPLIVMDVDKARGLKGNILRLCAGS